MANIGVISRYSSWAVDGDVGNGPLWRYHSRQNGYTVQKNSGGRAGITAINRSQLQGITFYGSRRPVIKQSRWTDKLTILTPWDELTSRTLLREREVQAPQGEIAVGRHKARMSDQKLWFDIILPQSCRFILKTGLIWYIFPLYFFSTIYWSRTIFVRKLSSYT